MPTIATREKLQAIWWAMPTLRLILPTSLKLPSYFQTVEDSSILELNKLANSFNNMAKQLHESFTALEKSKELSS